MAQDIDSKLVRKLAKLLEETGLGELEYATDNWRIRVAMPSKTVNSVLSPKTAISASQQIITEASDSAQNLEQPGALRSPMVGTAYLSPDPSSPPFVSVGSTVSKGDTVMIIEAMKVMNSIAAHCTGTVKEILVTSSQPIEFGQILMVIE